MANKTIVYLFLIITFINSGYAFDKLSPQFKSKISPNLQSKVLQSKEKAKGVAQDTNQKTNEKLLGNIENAKHKAEAVNNLSPDSLDSEGLRIRNEAYHDKNSELHQASKLWNVEKRKQYSADDSIFYKFDSVTKNVQEIFGKPCTEKKGQPSKGYIIDKIERKAYEEILEKNTCEHLRNSFSCINDLIAHCTSIAEKELDIKNLKVTGDTIIPASYDIKTGVVSVGTDNCTHSVGWSGNIREGKAYDYRVEFDIDRVDSVHSFKAVKINYDDFILIKLNGHIIYAGPFGGDKLEVLNQTAENRAFIGRTFWGKNRYRYWYERLVSTGNGIYNAEQWIWRRNNVDLELKSYLNTGKNIMDIRIVVAGGGGLYLNFKVRAKQCNGWTTEWREICVQD
jgi:hypothetical protein